jgi:hypothetical protein
VYNCRRIDGTDLVVDGGAVIVGSLSNEAKGKLDNAPADTNAAIATAKSEAISEARTDIPETALAQAVQDKLNAAGGGSTLARPRIGYALGTARPTADFVDWIARGKPTNIDLNAGDTLDVVVPPAPVLTGGNGDSLVTITTNDLRDENGVPPNNSDEILLYSSTSGDIPADGEGVTPSVTRIDAATALSGADLGKYRLTIAVSNGNTLRARAAIRLSTPTEASALDRTSLLSDQVTAVAADGTAPDGVSDLAVSASDGQTTSTWTNPADSGGLKVQLHRSTTAGFTPTWGDVATLLKNINPATPNAAESVVDGADRTGLSLAQPVNNTTYYYRVLAQDTAGNESSSSVVSATPSTPNDYVTGVASIFSLKAVNGFSGAVVRGKRLSDSAEQDFTATEITDGTLQTFAAGGQVNVVTGYDQSGNGNNWTPGNGTMQIGLTSATGVPHTNAGGPMLRPQDGVQAQHLTALGIAHSSRGFAISVVARARSSSQNPFFITGSQSLYAPTGFQFVNDNTVKAFGASNGKPISITFEGSKTAPIVVGYSGRTTGMIFKLKESGFALKNATSASIPDDFSNVRARFVYDKDHVEVSEIVYWTVENPAAFDAIVADQAARWGI